MPGALIIGGTGMLRGVSLHLARQGCTASVIARTAASLQNLAWESSSFKSRIRGVRADYHDGAAFQLALEHVLKVPAPPEIVVCWMHDDAAVSPAKIAAMAAETGSNVRFIHVLGSADPAHLAASLDGWRTRMSAWPSLRYQQVVLGFIVEPTGSRWLTHEEISNGVIEALSGSESCVIVGQLKPWDNHPDL